jgi:hypothetical protein
MRSKYNVKCSLFIPLKYHNFSKQTPKSLMHLSNLGTSLNIPSQSKSGSCIRSHSRTAISISSLLWNRRPPKFCFGGTENGIPARQRSALQSYRITGLQTTASDWLLSHLSRVTPTKCCNLPKSKLFWNPTCLAAVFYELQQNNLPIHTYTSSFSYRCST